MRNRAAIALLLVLANTAIAEAAAPRTLLLVDDQHVLYRSGLRREVVPLVRHPDNPLIPGKPSGQLGYCSTYRDPATGKYQLWYQTTAGGKGVAYAESEDGIRWNLPKLDIVKGPKKSSTKTKAKFKIDTDADAKLTCKLDKRHAKSCSAKPKFKVKPGKHKLVVVEDALAN